MHFFSAFTEIGLKLDNFDVRCFSSVKRLPPLKTPFLLFDIFSVAKKPA